jgi:peptidoglycan-N-acetylglucosamine deacetylase
VAASAGAPIAPFFRFPALRQTQETVAYLAERNIGIFSADLDSFDFMTKKPEKVIESVMTKIKKRGKGIILMHDFQRPTSIAMPELLAQLKTAGFKVVQVKAKDAVKTLPQYDAAMEKVLAGQTADARPVSSVVRTIGSGDN